MKNLLIRSRWTVAACIGLAMDGAAQSAYFSVDARLSNLGVEQNIDFELARSVSSGEDLQFATFNFGGGTNAAGDSIDQSIREHQLTLFDDLDAERGFAQTTPAFPFPPGALLSWSGVQAGDTPLNPDPLLQGHYRLNAKPETGIGGDLAIDLIGPADAIAVTGLATPGVGQFIDSLKFGTTGGGTATITHSADNLHVNQDLIVAHTGNAALNVAGGQYTLGTVTVNPGGTVNLSGADSGSMARLVIDGGSFIRTGGSFTVPKFQFEIRNGGLFEWKGGDFFDLDDITGGSDQRSVVVSGAGSTLRQVDDVDHNNHVRIENDVSVSVLQGGQLDAEYLILYDGSVTVDGLGSSLDVTAGQSQFLDHVVGLNGEASLTLSNEATASFASAVTTSIRVGDANSNGLIEVLTGADLILQSLEMNNDFSVSTATVTVDGPGSTISQVGASTIDLGSMSSSQTATINVQNGGSFTTGTGVTTILATGTINIDGGTFSASTIDHGNGGTFNFLDGTLSVEDFQGTLNQDGGTLAPGGSTGTTNITGEYNLVDGEIAIDLGGVTPGGGYGRVVVTGGFHLGQDGVLDVSLIDNFVPGAGDSFDLFDWGSLSGSFSEIRLPTLLGLDWDTSSLLVDGILSVTASSLAGDYNADGFVSQGDLDLVLLNWGDTVAPGGFDENAIPGGGPFDGLMSQNELDGVLLNWGDGNLPSATAIPEPSALAVAGLLCLAGRHRHCR